MVPMFTIGMDGPHVYNRDGLSVADPGGGWGVGGQLGSAPPSQIEIKYS